MPGPCHANQETSTDQADLAEEANSHAHQAHQRAMLGSTLVLMVAGHLPDGDRLLMLACLSLRAFPF